MRQDDFDVRVGRDGALEDEVYSAAGALLWIIDHGLWEPGGDIARFSVEQIARRNRESEWIWPDKRRVYSHINKSRVNKNDCFQGIQLVPDGLEHRVAE